MVPINTANFPWQETAKIKKIIKHQLTQKLCNGNDIQPLEEMFSAIVVSVDEKNSMLL